NLGRAAEERLLPRGKVSFLRADAAEPEQVLASVERSAGSLGGIDILVNNAGVGVVEGALETSLADYDQVMDVNVRGAFCYAKAAFPHLERSGGNMLHIASDAGVTGGVEIAVYS